MIAMSKTRIAHLAGMKFLLIIGVVTIHSFLSPKNIEALGMVADAAGYDATNFVSHCICRVCVPLFFLISAFLFFNGLNRFTPELYRAKLQKRVRSLLVPYLFWCAVGVLVLIFKAKVAHMPSFGVFRPDGSVDWGTFFMGFWILPEAGYPYAFAFWFIRNLMVFCILSPLAWVLSKKWVVFALFFLVWLADVFNFYGFEWFVAGCFFARHRLTMPRLRPWATALLLVLFLGCACADDLTNPVLNRVLFAAEVFLGLMVAYGIAAAASRLSKYGWARTLVASTFMIYAVHQFFCSQTRVLLARIVGLSSFGQVMAVYILTIALLTASGVAAYMVLKKCWPRALALITGGR